MTSLLKGGNQLCGYLF